MLSALVVCQHTGECSVSEMWNGGDMCIPPSCSFIENHFVWYLTIQIKVVERTKISITSMSNYDDERDVVLSWASGRVGVVSPFKKVLTFIVNYELVFIFWTHTSLTGCQGFSNNKLYSEVSTSRDFHFRKKKRLPSDIAFQGDNCASQVVKKEMIYK